jgi:hypothetical protein
VYSYVGSFILKVISLNALHKIILICIHLLYSKSWSTKLHEMNMAQGIHKQNVEFYAVSLASSLGVERAVAETVTCWFLTTEAQAQPLSNVWVLG